MHSIKSCSRLSILTGRRYLFRRHGSSLPAVKIATRSQVDCILSKSCCLRFRCDQIKPLYTRNLSTNPVENSSESDVSHRVQKLVSRLESDISKLRRVYKSDVEQLLHDLEAEDSLQEKQRAGLLLLQCCGKFLPDVSPAARLKLLHEVWKTLQELGVSFSVEHYNMLLNSYLENGYYISADQFLSRMNNITPDERTYHLLLACACEVGKTDQAVDVISHMKAEGLPATEAVFNSLILGHSRARDLASAIGVLDTMRTALLPASVDTYTALMKAYIEAGDFEKMNKMYEEAKSVDIQFDEEHLMDVVKSAAISGNQELIPKILELLPDSSIDLTPTISNTIIQLVHLGFEKGAYYLLCEVPLDSAFVRKDDASAFGAFFIREMVMAKRPVESIIEICDLLIATNRNSRALYKATEVALLTAHSDAAFFLLKALKERKAPLRPHYFWPLFLLSAKKDGEKGVFAILEYMMELGVQVDFETMVYYVLPNTSLGNPESLVRKLQGYGLQVSDILTPVLVVLLRTGQLHTALRLCRKYKSPVDPEKLLRPLVGAYMSTEDLNSAVGLLKAWMSTSSKRDSDWAGQFILEVLVSPKKNDRKDVNSIIQMFHKNGIPISSFAADIVSNHLARNGTHSKGTASIQGVLDSLVHTGLKVSSSELFSQHITHPRDMSLEELECHLVELKSKDMNTRGVLRRLLQLYCQQGNVEKAMEIVKEFKSSNYEFSAGMQASLFDLHVRLGQLEEAETALMELSKMAPGFKLDEFKIIDFATLLVANHQYRGAVAILEKQAGFGVVRGGPAVVRNCWRLLQAVAEKGEPEKVKHMLEHLVTLGYCSISNILLGPVIRAHLIKGSLLGAVKEYKQCAAEHRSTPLQHELLCRLVSVADNADNEATNMLQDVLDATQKAHGTASTHVALAVALAETGKIKQLNNLIKDPSVSIRPGLLINRCKKLADEGKLEALENIAIVSRGIPNLDRAAVYNLMMTVYNSLGDCDGALSLWTSLQEQDIRPSNSFLNTLASLLRSHKREVPFVPP